MSLKVTDLRPEVLAFAFLMEETLRKHDRTKGPQGWKFMDKHRLTNIGVYEAKDLHFAVLGGASAATLVTKAGSVGNMAMMVADVMGILPLPWAEAELRRCREEDTSFEDGLIAAMSGKCEGTD